jgi:hypothetical protein
MSLGTRFRRLPAELQLAVARGMGRDATIEEWRRFERKSRDSIVTFDTLFAEWLSLQPSRSRFWHFAGNEEEIAFLAKHADSECLSFRCHGSPAYVGSAAQTKYIGALHGAVPRGCCGMVGGKRYARRMLLLAGMQSLQRQSARLATVATRPYGGRDTWRVDAMGWRVLRGGAMLAWRTDSGDSANGSSGSSRSGGVVAAEQPTSVPWMEGVDGCRRRAVLEY